MKLTQSQLQKIIKEEVEDWRKTAMARQTSPGGMAAAAGIERLRAIARQLEQWAGDDDDIGNVVAELQNAIGDMEQIVGVGPGLRKWHEKSIPSRRPLGATKVPYVPSYAVGDEPTPRGK